MESVKSWCGNDKIFRTYLKGSGKQCKDPHKGIKSVRSWNEVQKFSSFGGALKPDVIDISFDSPDMSEMFLDIADAKNWRCMVLENPENHHIHTFWRIPTDWKYRDGQDKVLACGLVADIHHGETYIPLRVTNTERYPPVYDIYEDETYQNVPEELFPVNTKIKLWNMKTGDGRNEDLFKYILILQKQLHLLPDRIREMYQTVINPYVLGDKLSDDELSVILRDESFSKEDPVDNCFDENGKLVPYMFGDYLIGHSHISVINGQPCMYKDGVYTPSKADIEREMIKSYRAIRRNTRLEVYEYLRLEAEELEESEPELIAFNNGLLDISTGELQDFSPETVVTNRIPWDYSTSAYSEIGDKTLDRVSCGDKSIRALIEECLGSCFYRSSHLAGGTAFIFTGDGANGKSTILDWMRAALGKENYSSLELGELGDRFNTVGILGKLANIGDDISDDFLRGSQVSIFKKVVTGNEIKGEYKGLDVFSFVPYCTLIFSANEIPRISDRSNAIMRRLQIIPFNAVFKKTDPDHNDFLLRDLKQKDCVEYFIKLGVEGLKRVLQNDSYTSSAQVKEELDNYKAENNPILGFVESYGGKEAIYNQETQTVYLAYTAFCHDTGANKMAKAGFSKQINRVCGTYAKQTTINGKNIKVFIRKE